MITDEQREAMRQVRIKQAIQRLDEISAKQSGLINGNFSAVAPKYGLKVKELRQAYEAAKAPKPFVERQDLPDTILRGTGFRKSRLGRNYNGKHGD